ncbi:MAG TPA: toxin-antitoxin system HicB family antitoxin, partial [Actinomycetota bacterium]|nr:toxin-antitoxin system HicB family antitoxin [Actinomycetota bacterium]
EGAMSRINLRMPDHLKARIEQAAASEGLSVNAWLVRAAAAALERTGPSRRPERRASLGAQRYTGWAR